MTRTTQPAEPAKPADPASYAAAEAELEEILTALEGEGVDVDQLSDHVQRARQLITWCRAQVASAEVAVTELLADTPPADAPGSSAASPAGRLDEDAVEALSTHEPLLDDGPDDDGLPEDGAARDADALADDDPDD